MYLRNTAFMMMASLAASQQIRDRRDYQFERMQSRRAGAEERIAAAQAKRDRRNAKRAAIAAANAEHHRS